MRKILILILLSLLSLNASAVEKQNPTVTDLLDKFAKTQDALKSCIIKTESTTVYNSSFRGGDGKMVQKKGKTHTSTQFVTDGESAFRGQLMWGQIGPGDTKTKKEKGRYKSWLWDTKRYISNNYFQPEIDPNLGVNKVTIDLTDKGRTDGELLAKKGDISSDVFGYIDSNERIDKMLKKALKNEKNKIFVHEKTDKINGSQCFLIEATIEKGGKYKIWIDPNHGYNIVKVDLHKKTGDLIDGNPLGKGININTTIKNVRFKQFDNIWVAIKADITGSKRSYYGVSKSSTHFKRTHVMVNPDHKAVGSFNTKNIRSNAKVTFVGAEGVSDKIEYKWKDGFAVDPNGNKVKYKLQKDPKKK